MENYNELLRSRQLLAIELGKARRLNDALSSELRKYRSAHDQRPAVKSVRLCACNDDTVEVVDGAIGRMKYAGASYSDNDATDKLQKENKADNDDSSVDCEASRIDNSVGWFLSAVVLVLFVCGITTS